MTDIAPLGFAVDTKALADAAAVAQDAALKITGVADAADKVGEASAKSADKVKKGGDVHKETAKAVAQHSDALTTLKQKTKETGDAVDENTKRIHAMVEESLSKLGQQYSKAQDVLDLTGKLIPKNLPAQAFEHSVEASSAKKMGLTDADIARQAAAAKEAASFRKEMERLTAAVDPAQAKLMRLDAVVESLGKKFDAKQISLKQYNEYLDKIDQQEQRIQNPSTANSPGRHNSFLGELGRTFTYGVPRFGREARRLVYSAENEEQGGSLGAGLGGFAKLAGGAATGMLAAEAFRYIMQLPGALAEATDQAQKLDRRLSSLDAGGLRNASDMADKLHLSVKGAADGIIEFHNNLLRFGADQAAQDKVFGAAVAAGRTGGLDEQARTQSAAQFAALAQKSTISAGDIATLQTSNPVLAKGIASQLGTNVDGLTALAATGKLSGEKLFDAARLVSDRLKSESDKIPLNAKEWQQKAKDSSDKLGTQIGDHITAMFYRAGAALTTWLAGGNDGGSNSVTVAVPRDQTVPKALALADKYQTADTSRRDKQSDLDDVNKALALLEKVGGGKSDEAGVLNRIKTAIGQQLKDNPFGNLQQQVEDLTEAFGHGGGNSGLIGVWQQAIQIQREQEKQGLATAASLGQIVEQLLAVKRAQQAIADGDELKRLQQSIAVSASNQHLAGQGSYAQQRAALGISIDYEEKQRRELYGGGTVGTSMPTGTSGGSLSSFLDAIKWVESRGRGDYDKSGHPLTSNKGAMFAMQVLASTAAKPGYGIRPAGSQSAGEYDRVGTELATALYHKYGGDVSKAAAAYNAGPGDLRAGGGYAQSVMKRMGLGGGSATATAGGAVPDFGQIRTARMSEFENNFAAQSMGTIAGMVGDPTAFANSGAVSGGSIAGSLNQLAAIRKGMTPVMRDQLALEDKLNEEVKGIAPAYREAYKDARRLQDATEKRLAAEQESERIRQAANDNERRAGAAATGRPNDTRALELQLQIEDARRTLKPDDAAQREKDLKAGAAASSSLNFSAVTGGLRADNQQLRDQLQLTRYVGDELAVQQKLMEAKRAIESDMVGKTQEQVVAAEAEAEALIRQNAALEKKLDFVNSLKESYQFATSTIGAGWAKMFADMERTGKLHTSTLIRAIEDGFYGMLDHLEQKLVISPLIKVLDTLLDKLVGAVTGSIGLGGGGGGLGGSPSSGSAVARSATGNVFGPRGVVAFATGDMFNTPTRFAMGGGGQGIAGEGPGLYEAIMPLKRGSDGRLGVANHGDGGGGGTVVNVIDQRGPSAEAVQIQQRELGNGKRQIDVLIRDSQRSNIGSGRMDTDMGMSYGIRRPAVRR